MILLQLILPGAVKFEILSDRTERGGVSELVVTDVSTGLNFKGQVGAIQGSSGPVGFALARIPVAFDSSIAGGSLSIEAVSPIVISFVIGVSDSLNPTPTRGTMTYSTSIPLKAGKNDVHFLWTQMEARIRGNLVMNAPKFQPEWSETIAIQVARSQQAGEMSDTFSPIAFDFTVL